MILVVLFMLSYCREALGLRQRFLASYKTCKILGFLKIQKNLEKKDSKIFKILQGCSRF